MQRWCRRERKARGGMRETGGYGAVGGRMSWKNCYFRAGASTKEPICNFIIKYTDLLRYSVASSLLKKDITSLLSERCLHYVIYIFLIIIVVFLVIFLLIMIRYYNSYDNSDDRKMNGLRKTKESTNVFCRQLYTIVYKISGKCNDS